MTTPKMVDRQRRVYDAIGDYWRANGNAPTVRELTDVCSITSTSLTSSAVKVLKDRGLVSWHPKMARSLRILAEWPTDPPAPPVFGLHCHNCGDVDVCYQEWTQGAPWEGSAGDREKLTCVKCGRRVTLERRA